MLLFADLSQTGYGHLIFNSAFIKALALATEDTDVIVNAEARLGEQIQKQLPELNVRTLPQRFQLRGGRLVNFFFRDVLSFWRILRLFLTAKRRQANYLVILSMSPIAHIFFRILNFAFPSQKVLVIYHGELESYWGRSCNVLQSDFWFPASCRIPAGKNARYLVLGESIYDNLRKIEFPCLKQTDWVHHPYLWDQSERRAERVDAGKVVFGCIGSVSRYPKNSHVFFELARDLKDFVDRGEAEFRVVGKVDSSLREFADAPVVLPKDSSALSQNYFRNALQGIDVSIFTFGSSSYRLTASGSFLDGIHMKIPFLALDNDFIGQYAKESPEMGIVCRDYLELRETATNLIRNRARVPANPEDFEKLKRMFSPEAVSLQLKKILATPL